MVKLLSSMRFAFWTLVALILWLIGGALLTLNDGCYHAIHTMSETLILDWLLTKSTGHPLILAWFIGLCVIAALLALSFIFCTWKNLFTIFQKNSNWKSLVLLTIHVLFILIMAMHLSSMLFGFKYSNVKLMPGDVFEFNDGYRIELNEVHYIDDVSILSKGYKEIRKHQTSDDFHYKENYALLTLTQGNSKLASGKAYMLSPIKYKAIRATVSFFYLPKNSNVAVPGVTLVIMKNHLVQAFFILYALGILSILGFLFLSWNKKQD